MKQSKAILYTRVSTNAQAEQGTGLEVQEAACLRKAQELGAEVVDILSDEGVSGAFYLSRPGIQKALALLEAKQADTLITMKLDRSGRDADVLAVIRKRIQNAGASLVFVDGANFENNATGNLLFRVNAGFVEYEKEVIRERTMSGRRKRAEQGQQPSRTQSPLGYHIVIKSDVLRGAYAPEQLGQYVIVEEEARIVRELFARCAAGASLRQLAKYVQSEGIPTQRGGKVWHPSTVRYMLQNSVYKGEPLFGKFQWRTEEARMQAGLKPVYSKRGPEEEQVTLTCEPLVSAALWQTCQERLADNPTLQSGPRSRKYLLSGFLRCAKCRRAMRSVQMKGHLYYCCIENSPGRTAHGQVCQPGSHKASVVEGLLLQGVGWLAHRPERLTNALQTYQDRRQAATHAPDEGKRLRQELAELDAQEKATAQAQVDAITKGRSAAVYETLLSDLDARRKPLQSRLAALEATEQATPLVDVSTNAERIAEVLRRVEAVLNAPEEDVSTARKHEILASIIKAIVPEGDGYALELRSLSEGSPSVFSSGLASFAGCAQVAASVEMISIHCTVVLCEGKDPIIRVVEKKQAA